MNWDVIEGRWDQIKGELKGQWAKLTDDDVAKMGAKKDQLIGKLQERYGIVKDDAEKQIDGWLKKLDVSAKAVSTKGAPSNAPSKGASTELPK